MFFLSLEEIGAHEECYHKYKMTESIHFEDESLFCYVKKKVHGWTQKDSNPDLSFGEMLHK